jgi:hypothetical protein
VTADGISVSEWVRSQSEGYDRNIYSESEWECHITEVNGPDDYSWTFSFANEDMIYYDPAKIIGKWAESYEKYPDFNMDAAVYHSFKENAAYNIDVYDSEGGVLKNEQNTLIQKESLPYTHSPVMINMPLSSSVTMKWSGRRLALTFLKVQLAPIISIL